MRSRRRYIRAGGGADCRSRSARKCLGAPKRAGALTHGQASFQAKTERCDNLASLTDVARLSTNGKARVLPPRSAYPGTGSPSANESLPASRIARPS